MYVKHLEKKNPFTIREQRGLLNELIEHPWF